MSNELPQKFIDSQFQTEKSNKKIENTNCQNAVPAPSKTGILAPIVVQVIGLTFVVYFRFHLQALKINHFLLMQY